MPNVDKIDGVKINVNPNDHVPPHVHALYADEEALIDIRTREVIEGYLPRRQKAIARKYVKDNETDLLDLFYQLNPKTKLKK